MFLFYFSGEAVLVKYSDFTRRQSYEQRQADAEAHGDTERYKHRDTQRHEHASCAIHDRRLTSGTGGRRNMDLESGHN